MIAYLIHSRDGGAVMITIDFGTHWPTKGHKLLLDTGPAGLTQDWSPNTAGSLQVDPSTLAGTPARLVQLEGGQHLLLDI